MGRETVSYWIKYRYKTSQDDDWKYDDDFVHVNGTLETKIKMMKYEFYEVVIENIVKL